jgi:hypothetical protein
MNADVVNKIGLLELGRNRIGYKQMYNRHLATR